MCNCLKGKELISLSIRSLPLPHLALGRRSINSCWLMDVNYTGPSRTQFMLVLRAKWNHTLVPSVQAGIGAQAWLPGSLDLKGTCGSCDIFWETWACELIEARHVSYLPSFQRVAQCPRGARPLLLYLTITLCDQWHIFMKNGTLREQEHSG